MCKENNSLVDIIKLSVFKFVESVDLQYLDRFLFKFMQQI